MTTEELQDAWQFQGDMPDCTGGVSDSSESAGNSYGGQDGSEETFDLKKCSSYSNVWLWDLALSCDNDKTLDGCRCTFAEQLFSQGEIQCASKYGDYAHRCPADCSVCQTCMTLLGCEDIYADAMSVANAYLPYMIAAAVGLGLTGMILYFTTFSQRRRKKVTGVNNKLPTHLMEFEPPVTELNVQPSGQKNVSVW
eukprot:CAMPEP_0172504362 /NCGR_PEP_ID=MMETSP1066-20121228/178081_1 /TAXON_ID=671091 /ORGANISM="Coscinodiscus wailesii, Strain CCMP2513" /LENGTH=195 /DNA_ID=CAMNT_0013280529 /DNA_START=192 /DNA_END=776 /DNA_ORIENTATION=-